MNNTPLKPSDIGVHLDEDSPDLTDADAVSARVITCPEQLVELWSGLGCRHEGCPGGALTLTGHALRRRKPFLYWRVRASCPHGHENTFLFRADWMQYPEQM